MGIKAAKAQAAQLKKYQDMARKRALEKKLKALRKEFKGK